MNERAADVHRPPLASVSNVASSRAVTVRRARADERAALHALWERSVRATHEFLADGEVDALSPLVAELLAGDAMELWVLAASDDAPLGFMGMAGEAIEALFLDPE